VETNDKKTIVFVQNGSAFQPAEVMLGQESGDFVEVKEGLFDGDLIVTQRAPQLYAQSLIKSGKASALADPDEAPGGKPGNNKTKGLELPWWIILPMGGAIATGTFWAGMLWAKRGDRQREATSTEAASDFATSSSLPTHNGLTLPPSAAQRTEADVQIPPRSSS